MMSSANGLRPSQVCRALLAALEASEGRSRRRKRDQRPDVIGLTEKRRLLDRVVAEDPGPAEFERWLLDYVERLGGPSPSGAALAMARSVLEDWRMAHAVPDFAAWLENGAPSEDADRDVRR